MKMVVSILPEDKVEDVSQDLLQDGYQVTKLASTAGFLSGGTTTLMTGVDDQELDAALGLIRSHFKERDGQGEIRATIYVLNIKDFERIS